MQVQYRGDKIVGDLTTAHPQPMPNGDLVNLVSTVSHRLAACLPFLRWIASLGAAVCRWLVHRRRLPGRNLAAALAWSWQVGVGFHVYRHPAAAFEQRQLIAKVPHRRPLAPAWVHDFPATQVGGWVGGKGGWAGDSC